MTKWRKIVKGDLTTYPFAFELVRVRNEEHRVFNAWWSGYEWDGFKLKEFGTIVEWRPMHK
jgi:hypothetical protein